MNRITRRATLLVIALTALAATAVPAAGAHEVKVVGGKTTLALSGKARAALATNGITATRTRSRVIGGIYSFHPLDDGGGGTITHAGGLRLSKGSTSITLARLWIELPLPQGEGGRLPRDGGRRLSGVVGGKRIVLAALNTKSYRPLEEDPGFTGLKVVLNRAAAKLLNRRFGAAAFSSGLVLGTLSNVSRVEEIPE